MSDGVGAFGAADADVICVVGAGRSGTSVTARLLSLLGVYLGREDELLAAVDGENPAGFWEHAGLMQLDDELLAALGGSWNHLPPLPPGWARDPRLAPFRERAAALLDASFAGRPRWGWKDPRTSVLLPFWQALLPRMRYVLCVREPADVAASVALRDGMSADHSHEVWFRYTTSAILHTRDAARMVVSYEDTVSDPAAALRRLAPFLGLGEPGDELLAAARAFVEPGLQHHRTAAPDSGVPTDVRALHAVLAAAAAADGPGPIDTALDRVAAAAVEARGALPAASRAVAA